MPSKEPISISLSEFAELSDAPTGGKGGRVLKINWDAVSEAVNKQPMTNIMVFNMICEDKRPFSLMPSQLTQIKEPFGPS